VRSKGWCRRPEGSGGAERRGDPDAGGDPLRTTSNAGERGIEFPGALRLRPSGTAVRSSGEADVELDRERVPPRGADKGRVAPRRRLRLPRGGVVPCVAVVSAPRVVVRRAPREAQGRLVARKRGRREGCRRGGGGLLRDHTTLLRQCGPPHGECLSDGGGGCGVPIP